MLITNYTSFPLEILVHFSSYLDECRVLNIFEQSPSDDGKCLDKTGLIWQKWFFAVQYSEMYTTPFCNEVGQKALGGYTKCFSQMNSRDKNFGISNYDTPQLSQEKKKNLFQFSFTERFLRDWLRVTTDVIT